jgi:hypothetical protein
MNKIAEILLDVAVTGWIVLVTIAIVMTISSCSSTSSSVMSHGVSPKYQLIYNLECENCDQVD